MQVFIPDSSFSQSVSCLDKSRLGNQIYREGLTLIRGGWPNHPASKMWRNYQGGDYKHALSLYLQAGLEELGKRGLFYQKIKQEVKKIQEDCVNEGACLDLPPWIGREDLHNSHKARLLFKGKTDAVCRDIKSHFGLRNVNIWLKNNGFPEKNYFKRQDLLNLLSFCGEKSINLVSPNWYLKFGWDFPEINDIQYVWPK